MTDSAVLHAEEQAPLEGVIKGEVLRMYQEVAEHPEGEFHFYHGRQAAEMFGYEREWLDRAPPGAVASFAGVGNPHLRSRLQAGEVVLDLGSGAGLDSIESGPAPQVQRSEEHTSELQSRSDLVCRLLLEKKKKQQGYTRLARFQNLTYLQMFICLISSVYLRRIQQSHTYVKLAKTTPADLNADATKNRY